MKISKSILYFCSLLVAPMVAYPQMPTHVPKPNDSPVDFSQPVNIILFIVLPLVLVVFYFIWRNEKRKDQT